jgi:hypothetical protein
MFAEMEECRTCGLPTEDGVSLLDPAQQELADLVKENLQAEVR